MAMRTAAPALILEVDDVSVQVGQGVLREAGWIKMAEASSFCEGCCEAEHCEAGCSCERPGPLLEVLQDWHNDTHEGAFRNCYEAPCIGVRRVTE
jgi:hypothetical protein